MKAFHAWACGQAVVAVIFLNLLVAQDTSGHPDPLNTPADMAGLVFFSCWLIQTLMEKKVGVPELFLFVMTAFAGAGVWVTIQPGYISYNLAGGLLVVILVMAVQWYNNLPSPQADHHWRAPWLQVFDLVTAPGFPGAVFVGKRNAPRGGRIAG